VLAVSFFHNAIGPDQTSPAAFQKLSAPSAITSSGGISSPRRFRLSSSSQQSGALSHVPQTESGEFQSRPRARSAVERTASRALRPKRLMICRQTPITGLPKYSAGERLLPAWRRATELSVRDRCSLRSIGRSRKGAGEPRRTSADVVVPMGKIDRFSGTSGLGLRHQSAPW
jgi:hypothetical protein